MTLWLEHRMPFITISEHRTRRDMHTPPLTHVLIMRLDILENVSTSISAVSREPRIPWRMGWHISREAFQTRSPRLTSAALFFPGTRAEANTHY